jgi:myosin heavy subunit
MCIHVPPPTRAHRRDGVSQGPLEKAAKLLGIDPRVLANAMCERTVAVRSEQVQ